MISEFPTFLRDAYGTHSQPNVAQTLSVPSSRRRILYLGAGADPKIQKATNEENEEIHPPVICHMMENG